MKASHLFWLSVPLLNTLSQLFIKLAAEHVTGSGLAWLHNTVTSPWMIAAVVVEAVCFVIWMRVLGEMDLSQAFPLSAVGYILIIATSWLVFGESISLLQLIGGGLILAGVFLISTAGREESPEPSGQEAMRSDLHLARPSRLSPPQSL
jgi:multidrug transporter EmrE-like cation transporter